MARSPAISPGDRDAPTPELLLLDRSHRHLRPAPPRHVRVRERESRAGTASALGAMAIAGRSLTVRAKFGADRDGTRGRARVQAPPRSCDRRGPSPDTAKTKPKAAKVRRSP